MKLPRLHLELPAQGFKVLRVAQWALVLITAGSLSITVWMLGNSHVLESDALRFAHATVRLEAANRVFAAEAKQVGLDLSEARNKGLIGEVAFANQLIKKQGFSWTRFLSDLEEAVQPQISIASVNLNFKGSTITLDGEALTLKDLTALVHGLESHPAFHHVVLSRHRIQDDAQSGQKPGRQTLRRRPTRTVKFTLAVTYEPRS